MQSHALGFKQGVGAVVERSPLTPTGPGLNPAISNFYREHLFTFNCIENRKKDKKAHLKIQLDCLINANMLVVKGLHRIVTFYYHVSIYFIKDKE